MACGVSNYMLEYMDVQRNLFSKQFSSKVIVQSRLKFIKKIDI